MILYSKHINGIGFLSFQTLTSEPEEKQKQSEYRVILYKTTDDAGGGACCTWPRLEVAEPG